MERRQAVIDLGSNSFRLVVFAWEPGRWWKRTGELHEPVRIGAGLEGSGALGAEPMERALQTLELYAHYCASLGIDDVRPVATSAIRDATNQAEFLAAVRERSGLEVKVLAKEEEARFGYLAAVNSTALVDGVALDLGGGSMQLTRVDGRAALDARSWPLGAVRMTERFLPDKRVTGRQLKALRTHIAESIERDAPWLRDAGAASGARLAGIGGTVRNLAAAAQLARQEPSYGVQGFALEREVLDDLVALLCELSAPERRKVPGIKSNRGDLILAGAVVVQSVMALGGFDALEVTEAGLREGVFFSTLLGQPEVGSLPLFDDVRRAGVRNLACTHDAELPHAEHVSGLALQMFDALAELGLHPGDPAERNLLGAAGILHDVGMAVDYDDHHKHSRYLILNAGLPGYSSRETALIGQMTRFHRKGSPRLGEFTAIAHDGDGALLDRCSALLRLAEQLDRARDQAVHAVRMALVGGRVHLELDAGDDAPLARWAAEREVELFARAFGRELIVGGATAS